MVSFSCPTSPLPGPGSFARPRGTSGSGVRTLVIEAAFKKYFVWKQCLIFEVNLKITGITIKVSLLLFCLYFRPSKIYKSSGVLGILDLGILRQHVWDKAVGLLVLRCFCCRMQFLETYPDVFFLTGLSSEGLVQSGVTPSKSLEFPWHQNCSNLGMTQALNFLDFASRDLEPAIQKLLLITSGDPHLLSKI